MFCCINPVLAGLFLNPFYADIYADTGTRISRFCGCLLWVVVFVNYRRENSEKTAF